MFEYDTYISCSEKDYDIARDISGYLQNLGIRSVMTPEGIPDSELYLEKIQNTISSCCTLVIVFTESANFANLVSEELAYAVSIGKPIIPYKLTNTPPSGSMRYFLSTLHWLDALSEGRDASLLEMSNRILVLLNKQKQMNRKKMSERIKTFVSTRVFNVLSAIWGGVLAVAAGFILYAGFSLITYIEGILCIILAIPFAFFSVFHILRFRYLGKKRGRMFTVLLLILVLSFIVIYVISVNAV